MSTCQQILFMCVCQPPAATEPMILDRDSITTCTFCPLTSSLHYRIAAVFPVSIIAIVKAVINYYQFVLIIII